MTDMFIKTSLTGTKAEGWVKDGGTWHKIGGGGLSGLGGWATITAVTGSPKRYDYTADGTDWSAFEWTGDGTVTTTEGLVEALLVGGGITVEKNLGAYPIAAKVLNQMVIVTAQAHTVTVGAKNGSGAGHGGAPGNASVFAGVTTGLVVASQIAHMGSAATVKNDPHGVISSITGTPVEYAQAGLGGNFPATVPPGLTDVRVGTTPGSSNDVAAGDGHDGVVIIRGPQSNVTATGGWV